MPLEQHDHPGSADRARQIQMDGGQEGFWTHLYDELHGGSGPNNNVNDTASSGSRSDNVSSNSSGSRNDNGSSNSSDTRSITVADGISTTQSRPDAPPRSNISSESPAGNESAAIRINGAKCINMQPPDSLDFGHGDTLYRRCSGDSRHSAGMIIREEMRDIDRLLRHGHIREALRQSYHVLDDLQILLDRQRPIYGNHLEAVPKCGAK